MVNPVLLLRGEDGRENSEEAGSPEDAGGHHEVRPVIVPRVHLEGMLIVQIVRPIDMILHLDIQLFAYGDGWLFIKWGCRVEGRVAVPSFTHVILTSVHLLCFNTFTLTKYTDMFPPPENQPDIQLGLVSFQDKKIVLAFTC